MLALAWRLRATGDPASRRFATGLALLALWQLASGLSNVVLGWPMIAAVAHTGGAALLTIVLASLLVRAHHRADLLPRHAAAPARPLGV
jgi:cytochrome c oxidase assembly protein subunit 15